MQILERTLTTVESPGGNVRNQISFYAFACLAAVVCASITASDARSQEATPGRPYSDVYFEFQVAKHVAMLPGNPAPRYPDMLRAANVEGQVLAQFVVDTAGHADSSTFKVLRSTHEMFTNSVRAILPTLKFSPAEIGGGRKVKQLVQMPFVFSLSSPAPTKPPE